MPLAHTARAECADGAPAGLSEAEAAERPFIASMGIYVFRKDVLIKLLKTSFPKARHSRAATQTLHLNPMRGAALEEAAAPEGRAFPLRHTWP